MTLRLKFTEKVPHNKRWRRTGIWDFAIVYVKSQDTFYRILGWPEWQMDDAVPDSIHTATAKVRVMDDPVILAKLAANDRLFINLESCGVVEVFEE